MATPMAANAVRTDALLIAQATGGRPVLREKKARAITGVTTDSRAVLPGCAFVALRGANHDGHSYVDLAIAGGAALAVVEFGRAPADPRADVVEVADTLVAWGLIARSHLRDWRRARPDARMVAITGSAGKTTTKEICAALLRTLGGCFATEGNLNNRIGLPSEALRVQSQHRFVVLEMGMSRPGEIAALAAVAEPDVAVITNVGLAHAEGVGGTTADVAREKGAIYAALPDHGVAVVNADDHHVVRQAVRARAGVARRTFGLAAGAHVSLLGRVAVPGVGSRLRVARRGRTDEFTLAIPGEAAAIDFVAALAAADAAAGDLLSSSHVERALATIGPIPGRTKVTRLPDGVVVIDDTYNANPVSMRAALSTLTELAEGRRVAVLGEMRELGPDAEKEHDALGAAAAEAGVMLLVSCGGLADVTARAAASRGVSVLFADDAEAAARLIVDHVGEGDTVLVKASRSVGAERVVRAMVQARGGPA